MFRAVFIQKKTDAINVQVAVWYILMEKKETWNHHISFWTHHLGFWWIDGSCNHELSINMKNDLTVDGQFMFTSLIGILLNTPINHRNPIKNQHQHEKLKGYSHVLSISSIFQVYFKHISYTLPETLVTVRTWKKTGWKTIVPFWDCLFWQVVCQFSLEMSFIFGLYVSQTNLCQT